MEREKLSNLREGMVGRCPLVVGEDTRDEVPDVPLSINLALILLINIIASTPIDHNHINDLFHIISND